MRSVSHFLLSLRVACSFSLLIRLLRALDLCRSAAGWGTFTSWFSTRWYHLAPSREILTFMEQWQLSASSTFPCEEGEATHCWTWRQLEADEKEPAGNAKGRDENWTTLWYLARCSRRHGYTRTLAGNHQAHRPAGPWREIFQGYNVEGLATSKQRSRAVHFPRSCFALLALERALEDIERDLLAKLESGVAEMATQEQCSIVALQHWIGKQRTPEEKHGWVKPREHAEGLGSDDKHRSHKEGVRCAHR